MKRIVMTGASGLVGTLVRAWLSEQGHEVVQLVRPGAGARDRPHWNPGTGELDPSLLEGADGVIHLSGAGIADDRWTARRKKILQSSRVGSTALLARVMGEMKAPPGVLLSASAIGVYGDRGDEILNEDSGFGTGFLAELGRAWEDATAPASSAGIRVVVMRTGIVLDHRGGALGKLIPIFRMGLGGPVGSGEQWVSWIARDDLSRAIEFLLDSDLAGPVNLVSPNPVMNRDFARAIGEALHRPAVMPAPAAAVRLALGAEMANETALVSQRVIPQRLVNAGFTFGYPDIRGALRAALEGR